MDKYYCNGFIIFELKKNTKKKAFTMHITKEGCKERHDVHSATSTFFHIEKKKRARRMISFVNYYLSFILSRRRKCSTYYTTQSSTSSYHYYYLLYYYDYCSGEEGRRRGEGGETELLYIEDKLPRRMQASISIAPERIDNVSTSRYLSKNQNCDLKISTTTVLIPRIYLSP